MLCKKHYSQFSQSEKEFLNKRLEELSKKKLLKTKHFISRCIGQNITPKDIENTLKNNDIIECNCDTGCKAIIRANNTINQLCISLDLITGNLVSVWVNLYTDKHETINMKNYNGRLNIINMYEGSLRAYKNSNK